jgi:hypothetical protein
MRASIKEEKISRLEKFHAPMQETTEPRKMIRFVKMMDEEMEALLSAKGLTCSLLMPDNFEDDFPALLCAELGDLLYEAYGRDAEPWDLRDETWAVVITPANNSDKPVACATLSFQSVYPAAIMTRFEAVDPKEQGAGVGRLLFGCAAIWARFLVHNDHLVREGVLQSDGQYFLVAYISKSEDAPDDCEDDELAVIEQSAEDPDDNEHGHGAFLKKLGFIRTPAQHDFRPERCEIAFQREFHVPIRANEVAG